MSVTNNPLILIDGSSYLFRAYHALPPLVNSRGQPTGAVKGVINMIRSLIKSYPDSHIAVIFDAKGKTFRNQIYTEYKAHRPPMPDDLRSQIEPIHDIIRAMGLPLLIVPGVEADDVIGTLARHATESGVDTLVSTGDKDLAQLVTTHVTLINTMTNEVLDEQGVEAKFGILPGQIIDYLALVGDKSDNIPGVPSVGPKTAVKWLSNYGDIENLARHADEIAGKVGEKLRDNLDQMRLSQELATIKLDVGLDFDVNNLVAGEEDNETLHKLFSELEFRTWISELEKQGITSDFVAEVNNEPASDTDIEKGLTVDETMYVTVLDVEVLEQAVNKIRQSQRVALHFEFEENHFMQARLAGVGLSDAAGRAWYIPLELDYPGCPTILDRVSVLETIKPVLEDRKITKTGYDLKTASHVLQNHGITFAPINSDVLLASYALNSVAIKHNLPDMSRHYLGLEIPDHEQLVGKGRSKKEISELEVEQVGDFGAQRADIIFRLGLLLENKLQKTGHLWGIYKFYEVPLIPVLQRMERHGVLIDDVVLVEQSGELGGKLLEIEQSVYKIAGEEFNLGSPKQLQQIFYEKLQLPVLKKTKTGQPSTAEPILQELAIDYEMPRLILEHRGLAKLKSTYTDKLPLEINPDTGRIHSTYQQAVAATGRLSSTEPNLQNIPIRTAEGRRVRQAFVASAGYQLLAADYSQVELRIMAHLSGDPGLLQGFADALDVHTATAAEVFNVAVEEVTLEQRRRAKAINFGLIYGMSAFGLANQLGISRHEAQDYVERYFDRYPGVRKFMDETRALADEKGYVETLHGRRLYLPDIHAGNAMLRRAAQRTAINAPMQGTAADIIKRAMIDIDHWLEAGDLDARMLMQVHDELVFEVANDDVELLADGVRFRMISAGALAVPLVVEIGVGSNWDEAH